MRRLVLAVAAVAILALGASTAELAARPVTRAASTPVPVYNWSGFYVGANGGYGTSENCWEALDGGVSALPGGFFPPGDGGCHDATGGFAGGQIGYRWQSSAWVFGLEAQGDWAGLSGSGLDATFGSPAFGSQLDRSRIDAFGLFTGQIGYAWNSVLLYAKGGAAITSDRYDSGSSLPILTLVTTASETRWGGTAGVGVEFALSSNWSVGAEYNHLFMGSRVLTSYSTSLGGVIAAGTFLGTQPLRIDQDADLFSVRVNYRFGGPAVTQY